MINSLPAQACSYTPEANDIHYFTFHNPSHQAIDQWFTYLEDIYHQLPNTGKRINVVLDVRLSGLLPMTYIQHHGRRWIKQHPIQHDLRFAIIHDYNFPIGLAQTFLRVLRTSDRPDIEYFSKAYESNAISWLLSPSV